MFGPGRDPFSDGLCPATNLQIMFGDDVNDDDGQGDTKDLCRQGMKRYFPNMHSGQR
jgi:hypothetical protein